MDRRSERWTVSNYIFDMIEQTIAYLSAQVISKPIKSPKRKRELWSCICLCWFMLMLCRHLALTSSCICICLCWFVCMLYCHAVTHALSSHAHAHVLKFMFEKVTHVELGWLCDEDSAGADNDGHSDESEDEQGVALLPFLLKRFLMRTRRWELTVRS
jgi:hypothetical protein